ncbi:MAG: hypothetical protein LC750_16695 [Actinobacteria bacterium]|nr:hypothetical protein [Actinomycetota bacterium]
MANGDEPDFSIDATPSLQQLVEYFVSLMTSPGATKAYETAITNAITKGARVARGAEIQAATFIAGVLGDFLAGLEAQIEPIVGPFLGKLAGHLLGVEVSVAQLRTSAAAGGEGAIGKASADLAFRLLSAPPGAIEPGDEGARRMLGTLAQLAFNGWFEGTALEMLVTLFPDMDSFESIAELPHELINALGLSRLARTGLRPLARIAVATPIEWKLNKEHRPTLLASSAVARQLYRGRWDFEDVVEELARQGYSEERIDAIINEQRKFLSPDDVWLTAHRVGVSNFDPKTYLADAGYEERDRTATENAWTARRLDSQERQLADVVIAALVAGDIDDPKFAGELALLRMPAADEAYYLQLGRLRRKLAVTPISDSDARQAVKLELITFAQYRAYLEDRGFDTFGVATKELLLRSEIDATAKADELRARQAADRAAAAAATDAARVVRLAEKQKADALPAYSDVRRAFVRGLVPLERFTAAIADAHPGIDAGDAAALVADAQRDRDEYIAQQAAHAAALARDTDKALPLATVERSVLEGITAIETLDAELVRRGYSADARRIEIALVRGELEDARAAAAAKARADARAKLRGVSVADMERAVRLGLRTPADLAALLDTLETPAIEKGLILDLLRVDMQRDADAAAQRAAADAAAKARAIDLPLRRRLVLRGLRSRDAYVADLEAAGVTLENRALELQLLDVELADAQAAAARRAAIEDQQAIKDAAAAETGLTLAQIEHAVKLGILDPDDLRSFLAARAYSDSDIETLVASVVAEIPDLRAGSSTRATTVAALAAKGIDLPALERAVLRGLRTVDDYAGELRARGIADDAITLLAQLLAEKRDVNLDALRAKLTAKLETVDTPPTIADIDDAIRAGAVDDPSVQQFLTSIGVARDVALVYARLVRLVDDGAGGAAGP